MTTITPFPPGLPTPPSSAGSQPKPLVAPKLRDSCQVCAASKLKCHKERPTCSRCAKRGLICEYVASKRGGSKSHDRSNNSSRGDTSPKSTISNTIYETQPLPPVNSWFASNPTIPNENHVTSRDVVHPSSAASTSGASSDLFPTLLSPVSPVDQRLSSTLTHSTTDLNKSLESPVLFAAPDSFDSDVPDQSHFFSSGFDSSSNESTDLSEIFPGFKDAMSDLLNLSIPQSPLTNRTSTFSDFQSYQNPHVADEPCFCLVQALGLMKQLFPKPLTPCTNSTTQGLDNDTTIPTIQAVVARNEHTIEAVSTMLRCSCSQDGHLLTIISLILSKVLSWYAAAARKVPSSNDDNQSVQILHISTSSNSSLSEQVGQELGKVGSYCLEGEDSARMARQLVLSELHRAQCLLNQLSAKLKMQVAKSGTVSPLSGSMLDQLGVDLRKQLMALSLEIVEALRGE